MEWTDDVSAGAWLRDRVAPDGPGWASTMHAVVPRGFAAYARVFHPATRDRPVGEPWPGLPYARHADAWNAFHARRPEIDVEHVTWGETAAAFGRRMHPLAQWGSIAVDASQPIGEDGPRDADGWRYAMPAIGTLEAERLSRLIGHLSAHTATPDDSFAAVWEGHGGLVGAMGWGASRAVFTGDDSIRATSGRDLFNDVFRKPSWQPGVLSDEISRGARLEMPNRKYVLFRTALGEFADPAWVDRVPWADDSSFLGTVSPGVIWPADHAWASATEVDWDSTIVAGSAELIAEICADTALEAAPIAEGSDLTESGDTINR